MEEFLCLLSDKITEAAKTSLSSSISKEKLHLAVEDMAQFKCSGPDGVITEFYKKNWYMIRPSFTNMVHQSIINGSCPKGMNHKTIVLLHKGRARKDLSN